MDKIFNIFLVILNEGLILHIFAQKFRGREMAPSSILKTFSNSCSLNSLLYLAREVPQGKLTEKYLLQFPNPRGRGI